MESMCRLTHVIPSVSIKDRIIGGPLVILNVASHLASWITHSDHEDELLKLGRAPFYKSAHSGW